MPSNELVTSAVLGGVLVRKEATVNPPPATPPPTPDPAPNPQPETTFVLGTTKPDDTNTGAGVIRPYPTTVINGNVTLTGTQSLLDTIVHGRVICQGTNLVENCVIDGGPAPTTGEAWLVNCNNGTLATIRFCNLAPAEPSARWNAIGTRKYVAHRNNIWNCTDNFSVYSQDSTGTCNVKIEGNFCPSMVQWRPDYANNRTETHNDTVQLQGGKDDELDVVIEGNTFVGDHSKLVGTIPPTYSNLSAIMITPNTQPHCSATIKNNWLTKGIYTINSGKTATGGILVITGNRMERPGWETPGPTAAINIDPGYTNITVSGNTYIDNGATVPIMRG